LQSYCNYLADVANERCISQLCFASFRYEYKLITKRNTNLQVAGIQEKIDFSTKEYEVCKFSFADTLICRNTPHCPASNRFMSSFISPGLPTAYISAKNRPFFYTTAMASVSGFLMELTDNFD